MILSAYFGQHGLAFIRNKEQKNFGKISLAHVFRAGVGLICAAAVIAMSTGTVLQFSQNSQIKENFHNMEDFEELAAQVADDGAGKYTGIRDQYTGNLQSASSKNGMFYNGFQ